MFVAAAGTSTIGMSYSLVAAETLIAPGMPSCTARAGMLMPVCGNRGWCGSCKRMVSQKPPGQL